MSVREMFTGRRGDDPDEARTFGARLLDPRQGRPVRVARHHRRAD